MPKKTAAAEPDPVRYLERASVNSFAPEAPDIGLFALQSKHHYFDVVINTEGAQMLIDTLQEFIDGESEPMSDIAREAGES